MAPAKPTLKDIAPLSVASPSTVSAVLSGAWRARRISAETAERIRLVAGAEDYSATTQARGPRRGRSGLIGSSCPCTTTASSPP
jgi:LacI family fructose operon transcriptional repressor